ncbi:MAG: ATP-binding protein [Clostridia bacterium]
MKLRNIKISQQLNISLAGILLLLVFLGIFNLLSSSGLWNNTKDLYEHPFQVSKAIAALQLDVLNIRIDMKELALDDNKNMIQDHLSAIDSAEADALQQIAILESLYLGPKEDIQRLSSSIATWKPLRAVILEQIKQGEFIEARNMVKFEGEFGVQSLKIMDDLRIIEQFAKNKAEEFYLAAQNQKNQNTTQTIIIIISLLILAVVLIYLLRKGILEPLRDLTAATTDFELGKLDTRSRYKSKNEFGQLAIAFNSMTSTVQRELEHKEKLAEVSAAMFQQGDMQLFCQTLLQLLLKHTDSQLGAVYLLQEEKELFEHFTSIGLKQESHQSFSSLTKEGEFGLSLATGKIQHLKNIPLDTKLTYSMVSGNYQAREILTIPIASNNKIVAVISLASIKAYQEQAIILVQSILNEMATAFTSVLKSQELMRFSRAMQKANLELEQQAKELSMQGAELTEQNMELEMQSKQLSEMGKLKSSFLSNMSHELRTPLNSIIALSSVLSRRLQKTVTADESSYLEVIERNGKHLLTLVNDILELSRIEAGKEELNLSQFKPGNLVEEIMEMLAPQAEQKGIVLKNLISSELVEIVSDKKKLRHILQNILGNAVKFTDVGEVTVSALVREKDLLITIKDTGIGIADKHLDMIFDEFRQADESLAKRNGGTGLGLAIAKKYAELLEGSISVASSLGQGTCFTLKLPLEISQQNLLREKYVWDNEDKYKQTGSQGAALGYGKQILLVDDSEPAIIQTQDILLAQGYQVVIARNGKEALAELARLKPAGIMLDLMMPEMDGFQVLQAIRDERNYADIPVLILSAKHITKEELSVLKSNHVMQLIQKGAIDKQELLLAVARLVDLT